MSSSATAAAFWAAGQPLLDVRQWLLDGAAAGAGAGASATMIGVQQLHNGNCWLLPRLIFGWHTVRAGTGSAVGCFCLNASMTANVMAAAGGL